MSEVAAAIFAMLLVTPIIALGLAIVVFLMFVIGISLSAIGSAILSSAEREIERRDTIPVREKSTVEEVEEFLVKRR